MVTGPTSTCLIVGLGNPGVKYRMTRHNIGFLAVDHLAQKLGLVFRSDTHMQASYCETILKYDTKKLREDVVAKHEQRMRGQREFIDKIIAANAHDTALVGLDEQAKLEYASKQAGIRAGKLLGPLTEQEIDEQVKKLLQHQTVQLHLLKPESYMNLSGGPTRSYIDSKIVGKGVPMMKYLKNRSSTRDGPCRVLVISDDISVPYGQMRMKYKGGDGGHNGLASIEQRLGTDRYHRLKLGIAPTDERMRGQQINMADYVLKNFNSYDEQPLMPYLLEQSSRVLLDYLHFDMQTVMNKANSIDVYESDRHKLE